MTRPLSPVVLSLLLSACGPDGPGVKPVVRVPWGASGAAAGGGRARWAYTPSGPRGLLGRHALEGGATLYFGRRGERWLADEARGEAVAAGDLAEQDLVASARSASGGWIFVGDGGAIYEADEPLGAFRRVTTAPEPVARLEASAQGLLAVTLRGTLLRSADGGASFTRAPLGAGPASDEPFVADVQLTEGGRGLLLAYPERLYETTDGGLHWRPLEARPVGAQRLHRLGEEGVLVQGVFSSLEWRPGAAPRASRAQPEEGVFKLPVELGAAPDASSFGTGVAFWRGAQVVEAQPPEKRNGPWRLGVGAAGERLTLTTLAGTEGCQRLALDGDERTLMAACSTVARGSSQASIKLLRYATPEGEPEVLDGTLEGALGEARLALGPDDRVLVWGACRAGASRAACDGEAALLLPRWPGPSPREALRALEAAVGAAGSPAAAPSGSAGPPESAPSPWLSVASAGQSGRPLAARFGPGGVAYLVAQQGKTRELGLFVSRDGGRRFEGRELGLAGALEESDRRRLTGLRAASLSTTDDGIVSIAFEGASGALVAVTDEDGRVLSASPTPTASSSTHVGLAGRRVLVADGARAFESLDGGVSWTPLGEPPSLRCPDRGTCERRVGCSAAGCLVGDTIARVGWGGQREARPAVEPSVAAVGVRSAPLPPLTCRLGRDKWQPLARGADLPSADRADRGKIAWSSAAVDPVKGQVTIVHGLPSGKIEEVTLLPAARDLDRTAQHVSLTQVEGTAVVRLELAPRPDGAPSVRRAEVAWENQLEGKRSRATLPLPADLRVAPEGSPGSILGVVPSMLSISNGGVFVQLGGERSEVLFADHRGHVDRAPAPQAPTAGADGEAVSLRAEAVRVDNRTLAIGYGDGLVARLGKTPGEAEATAVFAPATSPFQPSSNLSFTYLNGSPWLSHVAFIPRAALSRVTLMPFQASGPLLGSPVAGPSQRLFADQPRACAAADRARSPRLVVQPEPGTRRGLLIEGPDGSPFAGMISGAMVMYGNAAAPCGTVVEGVSATEDAPDRERALVYLDALDHSWFFRAGVGDVIEARPMSCRVAAPGTVLPPELQAAVDAGPGASVSAGPRRPGRRPPPRIRRP